MAVTRERAAGTADWPYRLEALARSLERRTHAASSGSTIPEGAAASLAAVLRSRTATR